MLAAKVEGNASPRLAEDGQLMRLARGLYRLTSTQVFSNPDLAVVVAKAPEAVVCLISALALEPLGQWQYG